MAESALERRVREHFEDVTSEHEMAILHEEGLYRHLRFAKPGTWMYGYDLITWPGHLAIEGDIDSGLVFSRVEDMIYFFGRGPSINPKYWAEKITNRRYEPMEYSQRLLELQVEDTIRELGDRTDLRPHEIRAEWAVHASGYDLTREESAHEALREFSYGGYGFGPDTWEWSLREYSHHYLFCCHAIRAGVTRYLEAAPKEGSDE